MGVIIPGLIDDLGRECLIRTPYQDLPTASLVCKIWRDEIRGPEFPRFRKAAGVTRPVIILAHANPEDPNLASGQDGLKHSLTTPTYQLILSDPSSGSWTRLPAIPGLPDGAGLPVFCGLVGSVTDIFVIGGWDPVSLRASSDVYIYSFLSGRWRKGADMPGVRRSFFGCAASDDDRTVLVAGGHDEDKNALKSAMTYDVDKEEWTLVPDMSRARDECKTIFHRGKFHVISGYPTETQGCFDTSAEVLDTATWQWGPVMEDFTGVSAKPSSCVAARDGNVYACVDEHSGDVGVRVGETWKVIGKVPAEVRGSRWMLGYEENQVLVIGSSKEGKPPHQGYYVLDLKTNKWSKVDVPHQFCGHVQSACVLHL